jgi:hypothetical protein
MAMPMAQVDPLARERASRGTGERRPWRPLARERGGSILCHTSGLQRGQGIDASSCDSDLLAPTPLR